MNEISRALRQLSSSKKQSPSEIYASFSSSRNDSGVRLFWTFRRLKERCRVLSRASIRRSYSDITWFIKSFIHDRRLDRTSRTNQCHSLTLRTRLFYLINRWRDASFARSSWADISEWLRSNQIYQSYDNQDIFKDERMRLILQFCRKIRILESSAQSEKMKTEESYLIFNSKSILLSRSSRSDVASCSSTVCFSEHFEIFVSVDDEIWSTSINLR